MSVAFSILLPTYNEADALPSVLREIGGTAAAAGVAAEVVVVDDASPDGTADVARRTPAGLPVRTIERTGPRGLAAAVAEGIPACRGQVVGVMDADGSHRPSDLFSLYRAVEAGAAFAIGSRFLPGSDHKGLRGIRRGMSALAVALGRLVAPVSDPMSGIFCFDRERVGTEGVRPLGYKIGLELLVRSGATPVAEVPIRFRPRAAGRSKMSPVVAGAFLLQVADLLRSRR